MIRYLSHTEINKEKWDECISSSPQGIVYSYSWYLDIVCPGWEALVEDDYYSIFPLTLRKKAGQYYLYQPYFTQQLGLFTRGQYSSENKLIEFLLAIPKKFKLIEIQLNIFNSMDQIDGFSIQRKRTHHLKLSIPYQSINKNYSENLLRNLKKAHKYELKEIKNVFYGDIIKSFRKNRGSELQNIKDSDYNTFIALLSIAEKKKLLDCLGVINPDGLLIASAIFIKSTYSYIFLFSSTEEEAKEKGAMSFLIDSFIQKHSNEKKVLDFEGSMDKNLSRFYKGFGSQEIVYLQILKNNLPLLIRWLK